MSGKRMIEWSCDTCANKKMVDAPYQEIDEPLPPEWIQVFWSEYQKGGPVRRVQIFCSLVCAADYLRK